MNFEIAATPKLEITAEIASVPCGQKTGGRITPFVSGGKTPYTFLWIDVVSNDSIRNNLARGEYTLSIEDANNCQEVANFEIPSACIFTKRRWYQ